MKRFLRVPVAAAVASLVVASAASAVTAKSAVAPINASLPTISGKLATGNTVTANPGTWSGSAPISYQYQWRVCGADGGACHDIAGATGQSFKIRDSDPGNTLRVHVIASNHDGSNTATSGPTARIEAGPAPAPSPSPNAPRSVSPPTISGNTSLGSTLTATAGGWTGPQPINYGYQWLICGANGNACHDIGGATGTTYQLRNGDSGNTVRVRVTASNANGSSSQTSAPTARISATPAPAPSGCPKLAAGAAAVNVADVASPARLQIDSFVPSSVITSTTRSLTVRFHVSDTCGQPVSGALVYATAVPYQQLTIPGEATTDASGWVTLNFSRLSGFPASRNQQLMVMFVRARRAGDSTLAGISTRRLISMRVNLHR
jgi:hypothetical protein